MFLWGKNIFKLQRWRECWSVMLKLSFSSADQRWTEQPNKWNCKDLENCWTALGMLHFRYFRQNVSGTANFLVGCHNLYTSILVYQCLNKQGTGKNVPWVFTWQISFPKNGMFITEVFEQRDMLWTAKLIVLDDVIRVRILWGSCW